MYRAPYPLIVPTMCQLGLGALQVEGCLTRVGEASRLLHANTAATAEGTDAVDSSSVAVSAAAALAAVHDSAALPCLSTAADETRCGITTFMQWTLRPLMLC